ncbi:hypothetical protein [Bradyrhizobium sp. WSM1417]|uniref:hypothetical protein n=1 Tax=Bradyrhizobium sp. WSM1417 TaxID=754500 RepID=UPI00047F8D51|nr:hypothetical protein [Bradyrhizobium sp. WSM1417]
MGERRIRQLVDENILPAAIEEGFDRDLCRRRYRLFARGSDADWHQVYDDAIALAETTEDLIEVGLGSSASLIDVARACQSVRALMALMRFIAAVRSATQSERALFLTTWARKEHEILAVLLARAREFAEQPQDRGSLRDAGPC